MCPILSYQNIATLTPVYMGYNELPEYTLIDIVTCRVLY